VFSYEHEFVLRGLPDHRRVIASRHREHQDIMLRFCGAELPGPAANRTGFGAEMP
jgi:hypothetical protein